jgi:hypothetical protein
VAALIFIKEVHVIIITNLTEQLMDVGQNLVEAQFIVISENIINQIGMCLHSVTYLIKTDYISDGEFNLFH